MKSTENATFTLKELFFMESMLASMGSYFYPGSFTNKLMRILKIVEAETKTANSTRDKLVFKHAGVLNQEKKEIVFPEGKEEEIVKEWEEVLAQEVSLPTLIAIKFSEKELEDPRILVSMHFRKIFVRFIE